VHARSWRVGTNLNQAVAKLNALESELLGDRADRGPLRGVLVLVLQDHPHRALAQLGRIRGVMIRHDSILVLKGWSIHHSRGASLRS
jgi:hypothetical protein